MINGRRKGEEGSAAEFLEIDEEVVELYAVFCGILESSIDLG